MKAPKKRDSSPKAKTGKTKRQSTAEATKREIDQIFSLTAFSMEDIPKLG